MKIIMFGYLQKTIGLIQHFWTEVKLLNFQLHYGDSFQLFCFIMAIRFIFSCFIMVISFAFFLFHYGLSQIYLSTLKNSLKDTEFLWKMWVLGHGLSSCCCAPTFKDSPKDENHNQRYKFYGPPCLFFSESKFSIASCFGGGWFDPEEERPPNHPSATYKAVTELFTRYRKDCCATLQTLLKAVQYTILTTLWIKSTRILLLLIYDCCGWLYWSRKLLI